MRQPPGSVEMERFVQYVVAGGLVMVVGLWVAELTPLWSVPWVLGVLAAVGGTALALAGIYRELSL